MRPVRSLLVIAPNGGNGGAQTVCLRAATVAIERGWRVTCLVPTGPLAAALGAAGADVRHLPDLGMPPGGRLGALGRLMGRTLLAARHVRAVHGELDGIVVNGLLGLPATLLARPAAPVVYLVHEVITRADRRRLLRIMRSGIDATIAVSPTVAAAIGSLGFSPQVVENGTPWPVGPSRGPVEPATLGCAASITVGKGQHVLLDAVSRMRRTGCAVELLGAPLPKDAEYAEDLHRQVERLGLGDQVRFAGHVADPLSAVRGWTVAVTPSTEAEATPLSTLEAMSVGVPVVVSDNAGVAPRVGDAGIVVPPGDADALAEALDRLCSDGALWARCAAAGPAVVAQHFAVDDRMAELLDAISDAIDGAGARP